MGVARSPGVVGRCVWIAFEEDRQETGAGVVGVVAANLNAKAGLAAVGEVIQGRDHSLLEPEVIGVGGAKAYEGIDLC